MSDTITLKIVVERSDVARCLAQAGVHHLADWFWDMLAHDHLGFVTADVPTIVAEHYAAVGIDVLDELDMLERVAA